MLMNVLVVHTTAVTMQHAWTQMTAIHVLASLDMMEMDLTVLVCKVAVCNVSEPYIGSYCFCFMQILMSVVAALTTAITMQHA